MKLSLFPNTCFFYKHYFSKQRQTETGKKNQANSKQHSEAELLLFENHSLSSSTLLYKNNRTYSKKQVKEQLYLYS